ncbi:MAG: hypothetical protein K9W45_05635 [Candidatus Heimdallarchaeum aukensis]|uniref:Phosphatidate cytidylyltransferase n=1 Tax=Candidatus Heimdallarchaeum aukensis TaxID=2876573 RepID=A0A9Y1BNF2_9ARCH|nr:MAG: hypothetical protein K9W45_05635 [Candidatus Heimdallarchaeum aukensis]
MNLIMIFDYKEMNWVSIFLSVLGLAFLFLASFLLSKTKLCSWRKRKLDHMSFLLYIGILRALNTNFYDILAIFFISVLIVGILSIIPSIKLFDFFISKDHRIDEPKKELGINIILTALMLIYVFFITLDSPFAFVGGIFVLSLGDGMGELVGRSFGKSKVIRNYPKTLEGSFAVFLGSLTALTITYYMYKISIIENFLIIFLLAIFATVLEFICKNLFDNLYIPLSISVIIYFLNQ